MKRFEKYLGLVPALMAAVIAFFSCAGTIGAQGSRKDDIVFNAQGRPMAGSTVRICTASATGQPCSPLAQIYSDAALTQALANPMATDGLGNYTFYAAPGRYEIEISGPNITTKQLPNVILPNDPSTPTFTTVTSTSGISAFSLSLSGNLAVTGSASIAGTLTVGGAPLPSVNADNQWTASQRFKGADPWHDITAYMPSGGCDHSVLGFATPSGTITGGTNSLSVSDASPFKTGCGIFIQGAGPTSSLATPSQGSAPAPLVVGPAGSTTVHYKVAALDANAGVSAASPAITITTAPATRTAINYVAISWTSVANAYGYLIYTDQNGGGSYVPLNYSFDCAAWGAGNVCAVIDKGTESATWISSMYPTTPPASPTAGGLSTTITSISGTTLTLAANASNSTTSSWTFADDAPFLKQALADAAADYGGNQFAKGRVFIPNGNWFASSFPFAPGGAFDINIRLAGRLEEVMLPIMGNVAADGNSGQISFFGEQGVSSAANWGTSCSQIYQMGYLGAAFVVSGPGAALNLDHICLTTFQTGIVEGPLGVVTTEDSSFAKNGTGPALQVDSNVFFSLFDRTNWNDLLNLNDNNPLIWLMILTNSGHISAFDFRDNSFKGHTIRADRVFSGGSDGTITQIVFDGLTEVEANYDPGFVVTANGTPVQGVTFDNIWTGDRNNILQYLEYSFGNPAPGLNTVVHGASGVWTGLVGSAIGTPSLCNDWVLDVPNYSGTYDWGTMNGVYTNCDTEITSIGSDVQTSQVLTSGGNDTNAPNEFMIGHVFRRPTAMLTPGTGGSLSAGTYYVKVTMLDVAGRQSAPSPEVSATVASSGTLTVSATTPIYFPTSCNVFFGTSSGNENNFFNSTLVSNGTCTFTLSTTSGAASGTPSPVGAAMRSFVTEENNANSCLFCGASNGGTGFLGMFLTQSQYAAAGATGGPGLFVAGGLYKMSGSTAMPATVTVASGTAALGTSAIASGACAGVVTATATGALSSDNLSADFNSDPSSTAGYGVSSSGVLTIYKWVTSGQVNFKVCNSTGSSITPGSATLQWRVVR